MAARLSRLIPVVASVAAAIVTTDLAAQVGACADRTLLTRDEIRRAGILRPGELLGLLEGWDVTTVDGVGWRASPPGVAPTASEPWVLVVDGERIDLGPFDRSGLHRLPATVAAIDSVVVVRGGCLVAGGLATQGALLVYTARPPRGFSGSISATTGSEVGDPGPFAFTHLATPNVDRFGDDLAIRAGFGAERWAASVSLGAAEAVPTDPAIADRYIAAADNQPPRIEVGSYAAVVRAELGGGAHELAVRGSGVRGFLRLPWLGREVATRETADLVTLRGSVPGGAELEYALLASWSRSGARQGLPGPAFDWRTRTLAARLEGAPRVARGARAGVRIRHTTAEQFGDAPIDPATVVSMYGRWPIAAGARRAGVAGAVTVGDGEIGVELGGEVQVPLVERVVARGSVTYLSAIRADDRSPWAWSARGLVLVDDGRIEWDLPGHVPRTRSLAADVGVDVAAGTAVRLSASGYWRRSTGQLLEIADYTYEPADRAFAGALAVVEGDGDVMGFALAVERRRRTLAMRLAYRLQGVVAGDDAFRSVWASAPRHQLRGTIGWTPARNLDLRLAGVYRSARRWPEYERAEAATAGRLRATIPAEVAVDAGVQKWFWRRRLRGYVGLRNLFTSEYRLDPAGAVWEPAVVLQAEVVGP